MLPGDVPLASVSVCVHWCGGCGIVGVIGRVPFTEGKCEMNEETKCGDTFAHRWDGARAIAVCDLSTGHTGPHEDNRGTETTGAVLTWSDWLITMSETDMNKAFGDLAAAAWERHPNNPANRQESDH